MRRVGELDGVRGIAILLVIVGHAGGVGLHGGGFVGVTLFFVLSGYLITGILARELSAGSGVDLRSFWERRARRILPALSLVSVIPLCVYLIRGDALQAVITVASTPVMDYVNAMHGPALMFHHTWSLAVEEQFYILWPLVLAALWGARRRVAWLVAAFVAFAAWRIGVTLTGHFTWGYYSLDTNVFALLAGAIGAMVKTRVGPVAAWCGLIALLAAAAAPWPLLVEGALPPLVAIAALALVMGCRSIPWLAVAPLRAAGVVSYGWYLWHYPAMLTVWGSTPMRWVAAAVALVIATMSWRLVERPVLQRRRGGNSTGVPTMSGPASELPELSPGAT